MARRRHSPELRRIRQGLRLRQEPAHGSGELLPRLVIIGRLLRSRGSNWPRLRPCRRSCSAAPQTGLPSDRGPQEVVFASWGGSDRSSSMGWNPVRTVRNASFPCLLVDVSRHSGVQTPSAPEIGSQVSRVPDSLAPETGWRRKCAVLPSLRPKLGTTCPWLLQCNRDLSQPSSAVELANLAAHA